MSQKLRAHFRDNWPIYRPGLTGVACVPLLWGAFELFRQNLDLFGLEGVDPAVISIGWLGLLGACYGHFAGRVLTAVKRKQGREE